MSNGMETSDELWDHLSNVLSASNATLVSSPTNPHFAVKMGEYNGSEVFEITYGNSSMVRGVSLTMGWMIGMRTPTVLKVGPMSDDSVAEMFIMHGIVDASFHKDDTVN